MEEAGSSYISLCKRQVAWYRQHGRYRERITVDRDGVSYVIGDWSWHRRRCKCQCCSHHQGNHDEYVDGLLPGDG